MAKWGEGDPRWIVEERPDATNVNNWHWKESDSTNWSKDKLNELLLQYEMIEGNLKSKIIEFEKLEGESTVNNRKGKLIYFYEWNLVLKWQGSILNDTTNPQIEGKITIPNLSEENDIDEIDITVTVNESNEKSELLKQFMYITGRNKIREQINKYILCLRNDYAKNLILPKKNEQTKLPQATVESQVKTKSKTIINDSTPSINNNNTKSTVGLKVDVKTIYFNEKFHCKANELWDCFSKKELLSAFTRGDVKLDFVKGGEFVLFGGNISGRFTEIIPDTKICQTWRYKQWPAGHFSNVEMEFEQKEDHTLLKIKQSLVPSNESDTTTTNWQRYYFNSLRSTFGFGSFLC